jgi:hypothetical protein
VHVQSAEGGSIFDRNFTLTSLTVLRRLKYKCDRKVPCGRCVEKLSASHSFQIHHSLTEAAVLSVYMSGRSACSGHFLR